MWITLNEPNDEMVSYQEGHQMLRAHALAWHAYDREFRHMQGGKVSIIYFYYIILALFFVKNILKIAYDMSVLK